MGSGVSLVAGEVRWPGCPDSSAETAPSSALELGRHQGEQLSLRLRESRTADAD